jgi:predicted  nucleic acid-binding Zn-ribbon protein
MKNVTVRLSEEYVETLDGEATELEMSRAEYIRDLLHQARDSQTTSDELAATQAELEQARARITELENQLRAVNTRQRDVDDLVAYVEEERLLQRRRDERQRKKDTAGVVTRAKWWLTGMPEESYDESTKK